MNLEQRFELHIREQHRIAKQATGYKAPAFLKMVNERGALQTAHNLLVGKTKIHEGLIQLVIHNRLDLSLEANVIKPEWRPLFSTKEIETAITRLKQLNYPIDDIVEKLPSTVAPNHRQPERRSYELNSIVRDQGLSKTIKEMYNYKCQVCGTRLEAGETWYAEAAHIRPLGGPHNGLDTIENMLCLCPNHHKLFDMGGFYIEDNYEIPGLGRVLYVTENHHVDIESIRYHQDWCKSS